MISRLNYFIGTILGNKEKVESERYFLTVTTFTAAIFVLFLCIFHIIEDLKPGPVYVAGSASLLMFILYYFVRFRSCLLIPKLIMTIASLLLLDITWYVKFMSTGPLLMFILVFGALVIWVWEGRALILMLAYYFLNIVVLFIIEYSSPPELFEYPDLAKRTVDIYLSFFFYAFLLIFLLSRVKKEFTEEKEKAVRSDKLKSAFLANMSHEIRTPLNSIVGFSQLLHKNPNSNKNKTYVDIIQKSSDNLLNLISDIIDLSKIEVGDLKMKYSRFSIEEMFNEINKVFENELIKKNKGEVGLSYDLPEGDIIIYSESTRLKQILYNLLSNAVKFTKKGEIKFSAKKVDNEILFAVRDTGIGIEEKDLKNIFERFIKIDSLNTKYEGTGIGLSIVDKLVTLLHGKVWVESKIYKGSSFFFTIPAIKAQLEEQQISEDYETVFPLENKARKRILLVEDDASSVYLLEELLQPLNHHISSVENGELAVKFMQSNPDTDFILMDLSLPEMDGYTASRKIRDLGSKVKIIAQTANAMLGDKEKALEAGCDHYISKPINATELLDLLNSEN